jgi:NAD(P)-dependent dehydrogenase (short-subunit alcohol dehydrogenase family)
MADMAGWTASDIPSQRGRSSVVTGTGGLGYETALALARAGGEVILAGRNADKGAAAVNQIRSDSGAGNVRFELLDLADLASIRAFGTRLRAQRHSLDLLINNAGVMRPPRRRLTADGFELQIGTNHLGHFALTAQLLPLLRQGHDPRVVSIASIAARQGVIDFDDLQSERRYKPMATYRQSKLANLMFALELQRRSEAAGWGLLSIAAHPGLAHTDLVANGSGPNSLFGFVSYVLGPLLWQSAAQGSLPILFAATSANAVGGAYYGPDGLAGFKGLPVRVDVVSQARDAHAATRLWDLSKRLTGVTFE